MKIAISAVSPNANSQVDVRFGRAKNFVVYDTETEQWESLENSTQLNAAQGAGIQTAEMLCRHGVNVVLTGHCGPKAFRVLSAAGVEVYTGFDTTVSEALNKYRSGQLQPAGSPDVEGHWQ